MLLPAIALLQFEVCVELLKVVNPFTGLLLKITNVTNINIAVT